MIRNRAAFTLIELLVVIAVIAILVGLVFTMAPGAIKRGQAAASLNNMRQVGTGFQLFANDNDFNLPRRVEGPQGGAHWPALLYPYLQDKKVYADPSDSKNFLRTRQDPLADGHNNTSYIMNGYNDLGAFEDDTVTVKINSVEQPSNTILLGNQSGTGNYYMDTKEGNQNDVLNKSALGDGANYLFADGSVRFILKKDATDDLWLVHKNASSN